MNSKPVPLWRKVLAAFLLLFFAIFFIRACSSFLEPTPESIEGMKDTAASICAKNEVESMLKSPSTAEFPWIISAIATNEPDVFRVASYVDAQNSFGAMIRTNFACKVKVVDPLKYQCETECMFIE